MRPEIAPLTPEEFLNRLLAVKDPVIVTHARPDGDTVGTAAALIAAYRALGVRACYLSEEPLPERIAFLLEGCERTEAAKGRTPIAVDVASPRQLGALAAPLADGAAVALMLDHHEIGTPFAPYLLSAGASSAGEVLFAVLDAAVRRGILTLTKEIAAPLYAAISSDTGGFRFANTTPRTHRIAADLLETGIDAAEINRRLFETKTRAQLRAEGLTARLLHLPAPHVAGAIITQRELSENGLSSSDLDTAVDIVRSLGGTEVAYVIKETAEGDYRVSLRSVSTDVAAVAKEFGGGGHTRAAGCTVKATDPCAAEAALLAALRSRLPIDTDEKETDKGDNT